MNFGSGFRASSSTPSSTTSVAARDFLFLEERVAVVGCCTGTTVTGSTGVEATTDPLRALLVVVFGVRVTEVTAGVVGGRGVEAASTTFFAVLLLFFFDLSVVKTSAGVEGGAT